MRLSRGPTRFLMKVRTGTGQISGTGKTRGTVRPTGCTGHRTGNIANTFMDGSNLGLARTNRPSLPSSIVAPTVADRDADSSAAYPGPYADSVDSVYYVVDDAVVSVDPAVYPVAYPASYPIDPVSSIDSVDKAAAEKARVAVPNRD